jgi:hypothetical protein
LKIAKMTPQFSPHLLGGGREVLPAFATYRPMSECPKDAIAVSRDGKGRLLFPEADGKLVESFAGAAVVIYLEQAQP